MQSSQEQSFDPGWRRVLLRTLAMLAAAGTLFVAELNMMPAPCWVLFALIALTAWPLWRYRIEYLLFRRRLVLSGAARRQSRIRMLLWQGGITRTVQVVVSLALAWMLLALAGQLSPLHWSVLVADALFLSLIAGPVTRKMQSDIKTPHLPIIARRWPLFLINGVVLSVALMFVDFFFVGAPDSRHLAWHQVADSAFGEVFDAAGCALWGVSAGLLAAAEALSWHFSQLIIPDLPDALSRIIAWCFFLLRALTLAWLFTALLLGVAALLERQGGKASARSTGYTFSRSFILTILVLALPYFYASVKIHDIRPPEIAEGVRRLAEAIDPCKVDAHRRADLLVRLEKAVADERRATIDQVDGRIDRGVDRLFSEVEAGVDPYLDWYFTVIGEYQRLGAVLIPGAANAAGEKLEQFLFEASGFDARLDLLEQRIEHLVAGRFARTTPHLRAELAAAPCDIGRTEVSPLVELDRDTLRASTATSGGLVAGIVSGKLLAKKTAAALAGKMAAKKSVHGGAALASKALAKKGTSSALSAGFGATLCAPAGPVAILCGVAAGLVTWAAVDKTLIEIDEALSREEMRAEILAVIGEQREALREQLKQKHRLRVDHVAEQVNAGIRKSFLPYEDGMGR